MCNATLGGCTNENITDISASSVFNQFCEVRTKELCLHIESNFWIMITPRWVLGSFWVWKISEVVTVPFKFIKKLQFELVKFCHSAL